MQKHDQYDENRRGQSAGAIIVVFDQSMTRISIGASFLLGFLLAVEADAASAFFGLAYLATDARIPRRGRVSSAIHVLPTCTPQIHLSILVQLCRELCDCLGTDGNEADSSGHGQTADRCFS